MAADKSPDAWVLARLDDGEALLVQRKVERGQVLMLGTGAVVGWSNLPLRPIFLPLLTRLVFHLAGAEQNRSQAIAGEPIELALDNEPRPVGIEVLRPTGETIRLESQAEKGHAGQVFRYGDTHDIGIYTLRLLGAARPRQMAVAVNPDPEEADPTTLARDELEQILSPSPVVFAEDPDDLSGTFALLREGRSLWGPLLWAVLALLVFETFISNRLGPAKGGGDYGSTR
jgi:hypothetical protein